LAGNPGGCPAAPFRNSESWQSFAKQALAQGGAERTGKTPARSQTFEYRLFRHAPVDIQSHGQRKQLSLGVKVQTYERDSIGFLQKC